MTEPQPEEPIRVIQVDRDTPRTGAVLPVTLVLDRLRSAFNVGNILRVADAVRVSEVVTCGYTATPPHPKLAKTARGCDRIVPCRHAEDATAVLADYRARGVCVYGVETVAAARSFWTPEYRFPSVLVFGNEALGLSQGALAACDEFVSLPAFGQKNSINVGNCAAVVLYEVLRQWLAREHSGPEWSAPAQTAREGAHE
jgi:tRNA G18 (ribose-2'-O)-methylase SpoU